MANPRVFVSSTCYDLASERDSLIDFCHNFGFEVALSERGDVFFHPDLHTHEACVNEIGNCHLLVLIIGGRFGGRYAIDPTKSVTNAEYAAAREAGVPIFTFIKHDVLQDHNVWQSNKANDFVARIHYPSIDKQDHAVEIFKFIDEVRLAKNNNSYFSFSLPREIHEQLRKQWAAMFLEGIKHRSIAKQMLATNEALARLSSVSQKIEELAKSIYKNVDSENAESSIKSIDLLAEAKEMFYLVGSRIADLKFLSKHPMERLVQNPPANWWEFLTEGGFFELETRTFEKGVQRRYLTYLALTSTGIPIEHGTTRHENSDINTIENSYRVYVSLEQMARMQIYEEFSYTAPPDEKVKKDQ
jgi:hypothetical protein